MSTDVTLATRLRQMVAALEDERQALAALDLDGLMAASHTKLGLCETLESKPPEAIDSECRALLRTAQQLNEVNRRVRNLLAANVAARLDALSGRGASYQAAQAVAG
jgi:hypothetical protein